MMKKTMTRNIAVSLAAMFAAVLCGRASVADDGLGKSPGAQGRTFYVDSENGRDSNDGLAADRAWRSLDQVNSAELKPGDTVRFRCDGTWRGTLRPASGDESGPITYTSHGQGDKPLLLGSRPRSRPEDWVQAGDQLWATLPQTYTAGEELFDLHGSTWSHHQEAGAKVKLSHEKADDETTVRIACENSGQKSNHVQLWGPVVPVEKGACLQLTFRARCSIPFELRSVELLKSGSPWTRYASSAVQREISTEWQEIKIVLTAGQSASDGRLHMSLGGALPEGAVLELQPIRIDAVTPSVPDPLDVDVGNLLFDGGAVCGWKKWSIESLENPYDYYYDAPSQRVFVKLNANPATLHKSIECALRRHVIDQNGARYVVYDGLAVMYGAAHGFGGGSTRHIVIRNCDLGYIGGGHQFTHPNGRPVRYGNAIEFWGAASDHVVENCRIWQVYDAALTNQSKSADIRQENIVYRNNVICNCEYSFEYWNHPETAVTRNIRFVNNTCVDAGIVWSHAQRPDQNGSHLMFYSNTADTSGLVVRYNLFYRATEWGSRYTAGWKTLPEMDHNLWYSDRGVTANWFGKKLDSFAEYQQTTGLDADSIFADPGVFGPRSR